MNVLLKEWKFLRKCIYEVKYTGEWNADAKNKLYDAKSMRLSYILSSVHSLYLKRALEA